jgi:uncharacterized protein (DUF342 family)
LQEALVAGAEDKTNKGGPVIKTDDVDPAKLETLLSEKDDHRELSVFLDRDHVNAYVSIRPAGTSAMIDADADFRKITETGLRMSEDEQSALRNMLDAIRVTPKSVKLFHMAHGTPPAKGGDGTIEWVTEFISKKEVSEEGKVDYRDVSSIKNVRKGEKLCVVTEPTLGSPGKNVFGKDMLPLPGERAPIKKGENVTTDPSGLTFYAEADGLLRYAQDVLSINPVYKVAEDVDFSVGHVNFTGFVRVVRNVLDGFKVRGDKGIHVGGTVGAATLESSGAIEITGGIAAKGKGFVKTTGLLRAKYLNGVTVEAGGDVFVVNEIMNCNVSSHGKIVVQRGNIVGGEVMAFAGVDAATIGSQAGAKTVVVAGVDFGMETKLKELQDASSEHAGIQKRILDKIGPVMEDKEKLKALPPDKLKIIRDLLVQLQEAKKKQEETDTEAHILRQTKVYRLDKVVKVRKVIYSGADVRIGECRKTFTEDIMGPVKLVPNETDGTLMVRPL